ncbi:MULTISPECIES: barstar family protein [Streptomyces]|uniref:Barstar (barnase inhibitor) domain-containing protein n=1 Tax=Streptomyces albus (strain ATCC 21838 / DSM 41398 / FERM P-419 / JCM 4703 / NBRC 107858) TaxID=1081613 RepID=A0A0B5EVN1_STRA4|nr:barstar family protein [Streptomyces sp. SCSIO ZS0520]AJE86853.1 hypothetical protein SLNWT_6477 [Streptomyces albus]AOU81157.1 hypothetical protein SLNHY_6466 [Streptomyces albus]AYN36855.1 hypothetical protein DUI70_6362 [Streptomyces albus]
MTEQSLTAAAAEAGWSAVRLDLAGVRGKSAFMDRCASALALPDWFGRNWDALADSLTDSPALTGGAGGRLLLVTGWGDFARAAPGEWHTAQEIFGEAARQDAALTVALALGPA